MAVALSVEMLLFSSLFLLPISVISQNKGGVEVGSSQTATTVISQNNGRVEVGSSLNATTGYSSSWLSPSGDFAFGFSPLGNNDLFLLSIWYAKIPDKTVVWYAHDGHNTMVAPRGSVLKLTADSGLVLNNPKGGEIWKSGKTFVENGVMNDTGNFVLQDENSGSLWETFSYPTDTVLPGQTIERNGKLTSRQSELSSRQSETNYTKGRFQLHLQNDGNLVLNTVNLPTDNANFTYFDTKTTDGVVRGSQGKQLVFDSSGDMFVLRENDGRFPLFSLAGTEGVSVRDNYIRATLDFDGIFALYSHPKNFTENARWSGPLRYMPDGTCRDCGYNITCKLKPDNKRPTCECLKGFSSLDPKDIYGGCRKSVRRVASVLLADKWVWIGVSITAALVLCTAYYLLRRRSSALASAGGDRARKQNTWLCLSKSDKLTDEPDQENMGKHDLSVFTDGSDKLTDEPDQENMGKHGLRVFKYESVQTATSNFSEENKLGEGGFGPVYKGKLVTGREIAVKKLSKSSRQGNSEFENEVKLTHKLQHTNLVQLFGYCIHEDERMLIYEYMPNKSLDYHIFDSSRGELLDWKKRFGIIEGITQGLLYLHRYSRMTVIHRDLKASNILLDENMNPKIADFGLARVFTHTESEANASRIVGTPGSVKSDVYNFGVLILEIISGQKKDCYCNNNNCSLDLVGHSWELWKQNAELKLKDRSLGDSCDRNQLLRCIHVSLLCVDENAADRPTMSDVISMLTNESMELRKPKKPAYNTQGNVYCTGEQAGSRNCLDDSDIGGR